MPAVIILSLFLFMMIFMINFIMGQYKKVPVNKALIIYGHTPDGEPVCVTEGSIFVWPVIQKSAYLDLTPIRLEIRLKGIQNRQREFINLSTIVTVAISNDEDLIMVAANRFLNVKNDKIGYIAKDIIKSQLMIDFTSLDLDNLYEDWKSTTGFLSYNIDKELNKVGLELINLNISEIQKNVTV